MDAIADIHIEATWLTKERFVTEGAAAVAVASGVVLGIRLRFHHHTPEQAAVCLAFHQPAANQLRGNDLRWTTEEGVGQGWEAVLNRAGYGSGLHFSKGAYVQEKRQQFLGVIFRSGYPTLPTLTTLSTSYNLL